jgi:hypothetical protein
MQSGSLVRVEVYLLVQYEMMEPREGVYWQGCKGKEQRKGV